jgi:hypothetical protein
MGALVGETCVGVDLKYEPSVGYTYADVNLTYGGGSVTHVSGSVTCRGCKGACKHIVGMDGTCRGCSPCVLWF